MVYMTQVAHWFSSNALENVSVKHTKNILDLPSINTSSLRFSPVKVKTSRPLAASAASQWSKTT
ncbi:unnamed protein product [Penicillium camemberti]|uniref:Str. FM013 n=1 Tax=Penicillium camemberti (strain FM 013) TaxID=1429867 RepID=A0A0G4PW57_PENC3|nr:unnamed protein product [Penicillium camemberti]